MPRVPPHGEVNAITLTAGKITDLLLLVTTLEIESADIST